MIKTFLITLSVLLLISAALPQTDTHETCTNQKVLSYDVCTLELTR